MTQEVAWNDGTGDKIYLTYAASAGNQTIAVSSDAYGGYIDRTRNITFTYIVGASSVTKTLTVLQKAGSDIIIPVYEGVYPAYNDVARGFTAGQIPIEYTQLEYVYNSSSTYLNTGITPTTDDIVLEIKCRPSAGSWYIFQSRATTSSSVFGISGATAGTKIGIGMNGTSVTSAITRDTSHIYTVKASFINGSETIFVKDETTGEEDTASSSYTFAPFPNNLCLWGNLGGNRVNSGNRIYFAKATIGGVCVMDYRPVSLNGVNGFYDMITGIMKVASTGSINAGPSI